jgi:hypothetical protein
MKNYKLLFVAFLLSIVFISCDQGIINAMPEINTADSATIIYYNKPTDNRFFKIVKGEKISNLKSILNDVNASALKTKASCESVGKIYFYKGTEQVYVIYFSDERCSRLAFIKNGERYEAKLSKKSSELLNELKLKSVDPVVR